jgi:DNA-binding beta-propeller fold protein YncE
MASLTRRGFGLAGLGTLASGGAMRPAGASSLLDPLTDPRGTTNPGRVRLRQVASFDLRGQGDAFSWSVSTMAWSPDGSRLVAVNGLGNFLNVIDTATWRLLVRFRAMEVNGPRAFGFTAGGRELVASKRVDPGSSENPPAFSVFEVNTGRLIRESEVLPVFLPGILGRPKDLFLQQRRSDQSLTVSPDGRYVVLAFWAIGVSGNRTRRSFAFVFNSESGKNLIVGEGENWSLPAISRQNLLAIATRSPHINSVSEVAVFDLPSLVKRGSFASQISGLASLAWAPQGERLVGGAFGASAQQDSEIIRVWSAKTGERVTGFIGGGPPVEYLDWDPSGRVVVAVSSKGTGASGSLLQLLPSEGGAPLLQYLAPDGVVISGACFCPRTARLAWHERGRILIHEIQGL